MKLGFGQIEQALQTAHHIKPEAAVRFRARLRYLQQRVDIGITRAGGGRRSNFTVADAFRFAIAIQFEQFGMSPERIRDIVGNRFGVGGDGRFLRSAVADAVGRTEPDAPALLMWFIPSHLGDSLEPESPSFTWTTMGVGEAKHIPARIFSNSSDAGRLAIINLSALVTGLATNLGEPDAVREALRQWANEQGDA